MNPDISRTTPSLHLNKLNTHRGSFLEVLKAEIADSCRIKIENLRSLGPNGTVNTVYKAETDQGPIIVRTAELCSFPNFVKERLCAEQAIALGVKTPEVLSIGRLENVQLAFHLSRFVDGTDLNVREATEDRTAFWQTVGEMTNKLHSRPVNTFGDHFSDDPNAPGGDLNQWVKRWSAYSIRENSNELLVPHYPKISAAFEFIETASITPVICHGNIQANNIRVDVDNKPWLLDWGSAAHHSPLWDIAELYAFPPNKTTERAAFLEGYGSVATPDNDQLLSALIIARLAIATTFLHDSSKHTGTAIERVKKVSDRIHSFNV